MAQPLRYTRSMRRIGTLARPSILSIVILCAVLLSQTDCGSTAGSGGSGGGSGGGSAISIVPPSATLALGAMQQFQAVLTGASGAVTWQVNGVAGGNATAG